jgi:hypothetical protein
MKSDQAAKRPVPTGVVRVHKRRSNVCDKLPQTPDFAQVGQFEWQSLPKAMNENTFHYSVALAHGNYVDFVAFAVKMVRPTDGVG